MPVFRTVPSANTLVRRVNESPFALGKSSLDGCPVVRQKLSDPDDGMGSNAGKQGKQVLEPGKGLDTHPLARGREAPAEPQPFCRPGRCRLTSNCCLPPSRRGRRARWDYYRCSDFCLRSSGSARRPVLQGVSAPHAPRDSSAVSPAGFPASSDAIYLEPAWTFEVSNDPQFGQKFWDVIGLYQSAGQGPGIVFAKRTVSARRLNGRSRDCPWGLALSGHPPMTINDMGRSHCLGC